MLVLKRTLPLVILTLALLVSGCHIWLRPAVVCSVGYYYPPPAPPAEWWYDYWYYYYWCGPYWCCYDYWNWHYWAWVDVHYHYHYHYCNCWYPHDGRYRMRYYCDPGGKRYRSPGPTWGGGGHGEEHQMAQLTGLDRPGGQSRNPSRPSMIENKVTGKSREQDIGKSTQVAQKPVQDRSPTGTAEASKTVESGGTTSRNPSRESAKARETSPRKGNEPSAGKVAAGVVEEARTYQRAPEEHRKVPQPEVRQPSRREGETSSKEPSGQIRRPPERRETQQPRESDKGRKPPADYRRQAPSSQYSGSRRSSQGSMGSSNPRARRR